MFIETPLLKSLHTGPHYSDVRILIACAILGARSPRPCRSPRVEAGGWVEAGCEVMALPHLTSP